MITLDSYTSPWRNDFPAFQTFQKQSLIWLDSAATAQKPLTVIQTLTEYYQQGASNVHRAQHILGNKITDAFEQSRHVIAQFIGADSADQIIFTRNTTEAINLVAYALEPSLAPSGNIVISALEHHANLLPWQQLAKRKGLELRILPITPNGVIDLIAAQQLIDQQTQVVAVSQMSNVFGTYQPVAELIQWAKKHNTITLIDGAQGIVHQAVSLQQLDCDFYVFSGHKLYAPEGIGVLYGKQTILKRLTHWQLGGEMVQTARYNQSTFREPPLGFEAGTPSIGSVFGLAAAINYLTKQDRIAMDSYERYLTQYLLQGLTDRENVHILGIPTTSVVSFYIQTIHSADVGQLLTEQNIAVRTGQHCCMPLYDLLGISGAIRVSLAFYNTIDDINTFFSALDNALELLQ